MPIKQGGLDLLQHPVSRELLASTIPARLAYAHKVLLVRGTARLEPVEGVVPEYAAAAERYFGPKQGRAWVEQLRKMISSMVRITITPEWAGLLDFQTRFPSALSA